MNAITAELQNLAHGLSASGDRLGAKICLDAIAEIDRLGGIVAKLQKALDKLIGEQNGPPLIRHEQKWYTAMIEAHRALGSKHSETFYHDEAAKAVAAGGE